MKSLEEIAKQVHWIRFGGPAYLRGTRENEIWWPSAQYIGNSDMVHKSYVQIVAFADSILTVSKNP
jgi:hypothetical protein